MPVPFRELAPSDDPSSTAGYLCFRQTGEHELRAALFVVDSRGEPLEFTYSRVSLSGSALWQPEAERRRALSRLTGALFATALASPVVALAEAGEVPADVFTDDLAPSIPCVCVCVSAEALTTASQLLEGESPGGVGLVWVPEPAPTGSQARSLVDALTARGLLLEPFERAARGLEEAYGGSA